MAVTAETRTEIIQMVVGTLDAAPGFTILTELVQAYDAGTLVSPELVQIMVDNPAFEADYPLFLTNEEFATRYFTNLLSPAVPEDGDLMAEVVELATGLLNGGTTRAELIFAAVDFLANTSEDDAVLGAAVAQFNNKTEVAEYFSVTQELDAASVPLLQQVIDGVSDDEATVTAAKADIDGTVATGETITLTTDADVIEGTAQNETIKGSFGSNADNTANAGDEIDGGNGADTLSLTATGTAASSAALEVTNVETINIKDVVGATFNAISVEGAPDINFTSTIDGQTSTVTNADEDSVIGMVGKGNLTVTYAGTADSATVSLGGVGTSATNRSTINVANGDDTETVNISTTGTNYATLTAGEEAAEVNVTGDGTNRIVMSAAGSTATSVTVDASASTGSNIFAFGARLSGGDEVIGGSGSDEIEADLTLGTIYAPTLTGIETLDVDFEGVGTTLDMKNVDGATTISANALVGDAEIRNMDASVTSITMAGAVDAATPGAIALEIGYDEDTPGTLSYLAIAHVLSSWTFENVEGLTITALDSPTTGTDTTVNAGDLDLAGDVDMTSLTFNVLGESTIDFNFGSEVTRTDGGDIAALNIITGTEANFSDGDFYFDQGTNIGAINITNGEDGFIESEFETVESDIGDITITATGGDDSNTWAYFNASGGNIGSSTITINGGNFSGTWDAGSVDGEGGSIGDIDITLNDIASGWIGVDIETGSGLGGMSSFNLDATADPDGLFLDFYYSGSNSDTGDFNFAFADDADVYISIDDIDSAGDAGSVNITAGEDLDVWVAFSGLSGDFGGIDITAGDDATVYISGGSFSGEVGPITLDLGDDADVTIVIGSGGATSDLGLITLIGGDGGTADIDMLGEGYYSWAGIDASEWEGDIDIMASGASGAISITTGDGDATIRGSQGADAITLGDGDDTVFLDDSTTTVDSIFQFSSGDDTLDVTDYVDDAATGSGAIYVSAGAAVSVTDDTAFVFEDGTDDTNGADTDIEDFEDLEDVGEFLAAAFSDEATGDDFVAVINDSNGTAYVYYVVFDNGNGGVGAIDEDAITLIGIVEGTLDAGDVNPTS